MKQNSELPGLPPGPPSVFHVANGPRYAQCGGKKWSGVKNCQVGDVPGAIDVLRTDGELMLRDQRVVQSVSARGVTLSCMGAAVCCAAFEAYSNPDQAAQAAKNAAEAKGQPIQDQARH